MNVDKGNQAIGGANAVVVGDIANSVPCGGKLRTWLVASFEP